MIVNLNGRGGQAVLDKYTELQQAGRSSSAIKAGMKDKIDQIVLNGGVVSSHMRDYRIRGAFDIDPSSLSSGNRFLNVLQRAESDGIILKYIPPSSEEPAFHIEIRN